MAFTASTTWEVRTTGASTAGGGFDVGNASFDNTITAASANTASPVITWTNYAFQAGDVGMLLFIKSGTNWVPGWYPIASVDGSAHTATLNAAIGAVQLYGGATLLNTTAGCATTASPTAGVGSIDYTQASTSTGVWSTSAGLAVTAISNSGTGGTATIATGMTINGVAYAIDATVIPPNIIGNIIYVATGSGFTVQRVQVNSVSAGLATVDKTLGGTGLTGGAGTLGGACLTISDVVTIAAATSMAGSNRVFVQAGTGYTISATITCSATGVTPSNTVTHNRITGYSVYRGDGGMATITLSGSGLYGFSTTTTGWMIANFYINCAAQSTSRGISIGANYFIIRNCKISNYKGYGIYNASSTSGVVNACEITGGGVGASATSLGGASNILVNCYIHDNSCTCTNMAGGAIVNCLFTNNPGASSDAIYSNGLAVFTNNTIYANGNRGIALYSASAFEASIVKNNLLVSNGGYGLVCYTAAGVASYPEADGNAYYLNTPGPREYCNDLGAVNPISGIAPYENPLDVILTASPFVHASATLNDLTIDGTLNTKVTSSGYSFVTTDIGSTIFILNTTGGWTANQQYTIASISGTAAILSVSPGATSSSGGIWHFDNYQLNTTAGGGAACTGHGVPGSWPGNSLTLSYPSMGAVNPQVGGSSLIINVES